jgi:hypothetical protein
MFMGKQPIIVPEDALELLTQDKVVEWRFDRLSRAGYNADNAFRLAGEKKVDTQFAEDLLEKGCPEPLALEILL